MGTFVREKAAIYGGRTSKSNRGGGLLVDDPPPARDARCRRQSRDCQEVGGRLKARLYEAGLKARRCEECGQDETWHGKRMSLILDHINGDATDNRLENLRIACPNCAATFDTHCGRNRDRMPELRGCRECGSAFSPKYGQQRFCSISCAKRNHGRVYQPHPEARRVERPPYEQLMREIEESNYSAAGRKYGVSDNAIRKWVRWYERERRQAARRWRIGVLTRLGTAGGVYANSRRHCAAGEP